MEGRNIINFYIRTLTPVHIGAAAEKHFAKGVDYLTENGMVYFIDKRKILASPYGEGKFSLDQYTNALSKGNLGELLRDANLGTYASVIIHTIDGEVGTDIKTHIKNTLDNKPYIPGTSLKGAIRSVIFNKSKCKEDKRESETFGRIQEDPFRYLIAGDAFFDESIFINTKTFNLFKERGVWQAGWKHNLRGQNTNQFKPQGFTFPYECIAPDGIAQCQIVFNKKSYKSAKRKRTIKSINLFDNLSEANDLQKLFTLIQSYTQSYIKKEIAFFKKYANQETDRIIEEYTKLLELNKEAPVLRIGQGSGFHSVTGDWKFQDHTTPIAHNEKRKYKSRKMAFKKVGDEWRFYPMGFIQLLTKEQVKDHKAKIEEHSKQRAKQAEQDRIKKEQEVLKAKKLAEEKAEQERLAAEESRKPRMTRLSDFKQGKSLNVDGQVVECGFGKVIYKVFVEGFEDEKFEFRYPAGMEIGTILRLQCLLTKKGKLNPQGRPSIKK